MSAMKRAGAVLQRWIRNIWVNGIVASHLVPEHMRWMLLRASGMRVERSIIESGGYYGSSRIAIGRGSYLNRGAFLDSSAQITIGAEVSFGMNVLVITGSHVIGSSDKRAGDFRNLPVTIGSGAWIGAGATILPGVTIGTGAVVGAGSLVTKDIPPNALAAGNPARVIRDLDAGGDELLEPAVPDSEGLRRPSLPLGQDGSELR